MSNDLRMTFGRPNHSARRYLEAYKKTGGNFPTGRIHLTYARA